MYIWYYYRYFFWEYKLRVLSTWAYGMEKIDLVGLEKLPQYLAYNMPSCRGWMVRIRVACLLFNNRSTCNIYFNNQEIDLVKSLSFSGVLLDVNMSWKPYTIENLVKRFNSDLVDFDSVKTVYYAWFFLFFTTALNFGGNPQLDFVFF